MTRTRICIADQSGVKKIKEIKNDGDRKQIPSPYRFLSYGVGCNDENFSVQLFNKISRFLPFQFGGGGSSDDNQPI
jgi:hypothetical protein